MPRPLAIPDVRFDYQVSLEELTYAIEWNQGNFSLILAHCNSSRLRQRALWDLEHRGTFALQTVTLPPDAELMFSSIASCLDTTANTKANTTPSPATAEASISAHGLDSSRSVSPSASASLGAIAIAGFETVTHLDTLLASADTVRDELRKVFHCPLVWWMDDNALVKLIRLAPNIHSWFTSVEFPSLPDAPPGLFANPLPEPQPAHLFEPSAAQRDPTIAPCLDRRYPLSSPWPRCPSEPAIASAEPHDRAS